MSSRKKDDKKLMTRNERKQRQHEETLDTLSKLLAEAGLVNGSMFRGRGTIPLQSKR